MKKVTKLLSGLGIGALAMFAAVEPAMAANVGQLASGFKSQLPDLAETLAGISYLAGIGFGIKAAMKFKEYNDSKGQQVPLSQPVFHLLVAAMLVALPSVLTTASETVFGTGKNTTDVTGTGIRSVR